MSIYYEYHGIIIGHLAVCWTVNMNSVMSLMHEMQAHFFFTVLPKIAYSIFHTCYRKEDSTSDVALVLQTKHEYENEKKKHDDEKTK